MVKSQRKKESIWKWEYKKQRQCQNGSCKCAKYAHLLFLAKSRVYKAGGICGFTYCEAYINIFDMSTQLHQTDVQAKDRNLHAIFKIRIKSRKCNNELQTHL